ncbi:MAG: alpha-galactosidase [Prevotella sp.]|nr:alpha-galactosidase [Prevotella sp.]
MKSLGTTLIITLLAIVLSGCHGSERVTQGQWALTYSGRGVSIVHGTTSIAQGLQAEYRLDDRIVRSSVYGHRSFSQERISDDFGQGRRWTITYTDEKLPTLTQTFSIYDQYVLTDIALQSAEGVSTNYMAPIVVEQTDTLISNPDRRRIFVPFDNDAWIRFSSTTERADTLRSYEVTSIYDTRNRHGLIIGAIDHDRWKNAVELTDGARRLRAFSGVADQLTRDRLSHGAVTGQRVSSARMMIGLFTDWRQGMEAFADANATTARPRPWQKAMPVGWNSWGALAFKVNHDNSTRVSDFFARELQPRSFANADGLLYTGLDSGWNSFSEEDLKDFADRCRRNNQVPCIYWTPFTDWGKNPEAPLPSQSGETGKRLIYKDIYLYANGQPQELDGAYAIDPTHPAVQRMMEQTHNLFRRCGYEYVKMDFMTHGRMEADRWYRSEITTGTEAYNYGMHLLDSIFSDMYLNLSISPIFPAQYAQSRRIACDAWNKIKDTEYTMNALSWGWWIDRIYQYNDADHVVLRDATEGENRARITSSVITGLFITGDDFSADTMAISRARLFLTNPDINRLATGHSFRPLQGDNDRSEQTFIRQETDGTVVVAAFNYGDNPRPFVFDRLLMELDAEANYTVEELWEHKPVSLDATIMIPAKDVRVYRILKAI